MAKSDPQASAKQKVELAMFAKFLKQIVANQIDEKWDAQVSALGQRLTDAPLSSNVLPSKEYLNALTTDKTTMIFRMYWAERQYFSNLFKVKGDELLELYFHRIIGCAFDYGTVAVRQVVDKASGAKSLEIYNAYAVKINQAGDIMSGRLSRQVYLAQPSLGYTLKNDPKNIATDQDYVFLKFGQLGLTMWFSLLPFLFAKQRVWKIINKNIPATEVKWHYKVEYGNALELMKELDWINDVSNNVIVSVSNPKSSVMTKDGKQIETTAGQMKVEPIILPEQPNAKSYADWEVLTAIQNYMTGHATNISTKKERNTAGEVVFNLSHFEVMNEEYMNEIRIFLHKWKERYGGDATVEIASSPTDLLTNMEGKNGVGDQND